MASVKSSGFLNTKGSLAPTWSNTPLSLSRIGLGQEIQKEARIAATNKGSGPQIPERIAQITKASSTSGAFYNRIIISPQEISLGAISNDRSAIIRVFNAYFSAQTLSSVALTTPDTEITITGNTPSQIGALAEVSFTVTAQAQGRTFIDNQIRFDFADPVSDIDIAITGQRSVPFPFIPMDRATESLQWSTLVLTNYNGSEQRSRNRKSPRGVYSLSFFSDLINNARINNLIQGRRNGQWAFPLWSDCQSIGNTIAGSRTISVDTRFVEIIANSTVFIYDVTGQNGLFQVESLTDSQITVDRDLGTFTSASIVPTRNGFMLENPSRESNGYTSSTNAIFNVNNLTELTPPSYTQYKNNDLFTDEVELIDGNFINDYDTRVEVLQAAPSRQRFIARDDTNKRNRTVRIQNFSQQELWNAKLWLHRRAGRYRAFWMPTHEKDFFPIGTGMIGQLLVARENNFHQFNLSQRELAIRTTGGTWNLITISSSAINISGQLEMTLSSPLTFNYEDIEIVSLLLLCRLGSDTIRIFHRNNKISTIDLTISEIDQ